MSGYQVDHSSSDRRALLELARAAVAASTRAGRPVAVEVGPGLPGGRTHGVFVTLQGPAGLRGCIGQIGQGRPLPAAIMWCAAQAALADTRFAPVTPAEVPSLKIEISILSGPEPCRAVDVEPGVHGVTLEVDGGRAVFLPQVATAEGWDRERLLDHLAQKAGLRQDAWRVPGARLSRFTAEVFAEGESPVGT